MRLADARVSTLAQNSACAAAKVKSQRILGAKTNVKECEPFEGSCDPGHGRRDWDCRSIIFRRRDMGHSLPDDRNRRLAWRPASADLANFRRPHRLASQTIGCSANEKASGE